MLNIQSVEKKIITLRNEKVIIESIVAELYGVETRELAQAVKNNPGKFPPGYILELTSEEKDNLKSKFLISSWGGARHVPKAFTESRTNNSRNGA